MTLPPNLSLRALLRLLLGVLLPLLVVGFLAEDVLEQQRFTFETPMLTWIHAHTSPALTQTSVVLNTLGGPVVMGGVFVLIVLGLWLTRRHPQAIFAATGLGSAVGVALVMKVVFHRARPELWPRLITENGASFPSGHSTTAAALATCLVLLLWQTPWRWPVLILGGLYALLMGYGRLVLGVHYPTDVLAGWLTGLSLVLGAYQLLSPSLKPHPTPGDA
ncbi:phosphatase PAP2 family protein [Deinococcus sp.]|uniref:phosphatase PAP2 family protein n=1 Tax=Deinococcus sp. TaxID=47478 RepID=UPI0025C1648F|nr:phosphatase PAP2 family protein [Deinococcus sp.]